MANSSLEKRFFDNCYWDFALLLVSNSPFSLVFGMPDNSPRQTVIWIWKSVFSLGAKSTIRQFPLVACPQRRKPRFTIWKSWQPHFPDNFLFLLITLGTISTALLGSTHWIRSLVYSTFWIWRSGLAQGLGKGDWNIKSLVPKCLKVGFVADVQQVARSLGSGLADLTCRVGIRSSK